MMDITQCIVKLSEECRNQLCYRISEDNSSFFESTDSQAVPPHVAEAMLMQSPLATSLLQSFLATSLWFGSPETSKKKKTGGQAKQKQLQQVIHAFFFCSSLYKNEHFE